MAVCRCIPPSPCWKSLITGRLLSPASIAKPGSRRCATMDARTTVSINQDIEAFIAWVDATFTGSAGAPAIQPDPAGRIYSTRLRRTLAYFIVRRPGGLIAAALQYGHVRSKGHPRVLRRRRHHLAGRHRRRAPGNGALARRP